MIQVSFESFAVKLEEKMLAKSKFLIGIMISAISTEAIRAFLNRWILVKKDVICNIKVLFSRSNVANKNSFLSMSSTFLVMDRALGAI